MRSGRWRWRRTPATPAWGSWRGCTPSRRPRCGSPAWACCTSRLLHLHTQFNQEIPWADIDMDFMNLNQAAHGDREFGFIAARLRIERKVVVGHWGDPDVQARIGAWARAACARRDWETGRIARFGENMREVAVTDGDKVEAQRRLGFSVNGYGIGDLVARIAAVGEADGRRPGRRLPRRVRGRPGPAAGRRPGRVAARRRRGSRSALRGFLADGRFTAFTDTFEDLHGMAQLPGLAVQRLMRDGYGFGAEGDWKTAAMVRAMKVMSAGLPGGVSFMEDYTYHLGPTGDRILGAHMLEVCPSRSRTRRPGSRSTRSPSAARPTPSAWSSTPTPAPRSPPASPTWASASGWWPPWWTWSRPTSTSRSCPVARASGAASGPADERRGLDPRRRLAPHEPRLRGHDRAPARLRGDVRRRVPGHRRDAPRSTSSATGCAGTTSTTSSPSGL